MGCFYDIYEKIVLCFHPNYLTLRGYRSHKKMKQYDKDLKKMDREWARQVDKMFRPLKKMVQHMDKAFGDMPRRPA